MITSSKPEHRIFLLSHMRANTSLVSHILGSHPQISGYYEMHLSYRSENDLKKQQELYLSKDVIKDSSHYLFDKLLHNDYELLLESLNREKIKLLVSIRTPEQSIKSIVNLFRNKKVQRSYAHPEAALEYYRARIAALTSFCERYKGSYYYYDAELIRSCPEKSLQRMQNWLELDSPLSEQYQMFSQTGQARAGDSSANMRKGTIITQQTDYSDIAIPSSLLDDVTIATAKYKERIINYAIDALS